MTTNSRMTLDMFIGYYEGIVPTDVCNSVIEHYMADRSLWTSAGFAGHDGVVPDSDARVRMHVLTISPDRPFYSGLRDCFKAVVTRYQQTHPDFLADRMTGYQLNRYDAPDGFMSRHSDTIHHSHGQKYGFPVATSLLFLNDNYDGGEFVLCDGLFRRKPATGSGIIFPSNFMFPHEVCRIAGGSRYSVATWLI